MLSVELTGKTAKNILQNCEKHGFSRGCRRISNSKTYWIGDKLNGVDTSIVNRQLATLPCNVALDDKSPVNELQKACRAFKTWYLSSDK